MWVERIGQPASTPWQLAFGGDVLIILRRTLAATAPDEGCALLLGMPSRNGWLIQQVWPCCNVWRPDLAALPERSVSTQTTRPLPSRRTRFALDPREQLHAQRWARSRGLAVVGTAHSHPDGTAVPSATDCRWSYEPGLMVIMAADQTLRAWWMEPTPSMVQHTD